MSNEKRLVRGEFGEGWIELGEKGDPEPDFLLILFDHSLQEVCEFGNSLRIFFFGNVLAKLAHQSSVVHEAASPKKDFVP
jgi:hypothetical protein